MNKTLISFLVITSCTFGTYYFLSTSPADLSANAYCAFDDPKVLNRQKFYEDDLILALYTHKPILPGHCLIIPKRHVERFEMLTDQEINQIGLVIKKVNQAASKVFKTASYLLLQKNGLEVGQTVPHVHFHYIPRQLGDDSTLSFLVKMYLANAYSPIPEAEMQKICEQMNEAMKSDLSESSKI